MAEDSIKRRYIKRLPDMGGILFSKELDGVSEAKALDLIQQDPKAYRGKKQQEYDSALD